MINFFCPRLYGGFENLKGGKTSEAMTDFTAGVVEHYETKSLPDDIYVQMQRSAKRSSLMSCSIKVGKNLMLFNCIAGPTSKTIEKNCIL